MGLSFGHIIIVLLVVLVLFGALGRGKIPQVMGDLGKGLKSFKDGLKGEPSSDEKHEQKSLPADKKDA